MKNTSALPSDAPTSNKHERWTVVSTTLAFLLSFVILALHSSPYLANRFVGSKTEITCILLMCGITAAAAGVATDPARGLAANERGGVGYGNLYYATWAGFGCSLGLLNAFARTEKGLDVSGELRLRGRRFGCWCASIVVNLVVMASSASSYDARCYDVVANNMRAIKYCRRSALGVTAGCIGCVASLAGCENDLRPLRQRRRSWRRRRGGGRRLEKGNDVPCRNCFLH